MCDAPTLYDVGADCGVDNIIERYVPWDDGGGGDGVW
jgi:hypothetical protein